MLPLWLQVEEPIPAEWEGSFWTPVHTNLNRMEAWYATTRKVQ